MAGAKKRQNTDVKRHNSDMLLNRTMDQTIQNNKGKYVALLHGRNVCKEGWTFPGTLNLYTL